MVSESEAKVRVRNGKLSGRKSGWRVTTAMLVSQSEQAREYRIISISHTLSFRHGEELIARKPTSNTCRGETCYVILTVSNRKQLADCNLGE